MITLTKRQQEIIDNSLEIISERGIQELTIKNLSKSIGVSEAALYRHFDTKIEILKTILICFRSNIVNLIEQTENQEGTALQKLEYFFCQRCHEFSKNPAIATVIFSEEMFRAHQELSENVLENMHLQQDFIKNLLLESQKNGEIRNDIPLEHILLLLFGSLRLMLTKWRLEDSKVDLKEQSSEFWISLEKILQT